MNFNISLGISSQQMGISLLAFCQQFLINMNL